MGATTAPHTEMKIRGGWSGPLTVWLKPMSGGRVALKWPNNALADKLWVQQPRLRTMGCRTRTHSRTFWRQFPFFLEGRYKIYLNLINEIRIEIEIRLPIKPWKEQQQVFELIMHVFLFYYLNTNNINFILHSYLCATNI